jgi:uridine kinase
MRSALKPFIIGIAGGTCSGKTFLSELLLEKLGHNNAVVIQHDSYYKDFRSHGNVHASGINYDHPDSVQTDLLIEDLKNLSAGKIIHQPIYDFTVHHRLEVTRKIMPKRIIIVEGILVLSEKRLCELMNFKIFIDAEPEIRLLRRIRRDRLERKRSVAEIIDQYIATVRPMHAEFVEPGRLQADIIINGECESETIEMLVKKIRTLAGRWQ